MKVSAAKWASILHCTGASSMFCMWVCSALVLPSCTSPGGPVGHCYLLDTRLRRVQRKDWHRDVFRNFTWDSGPSKAS